jgi:predicted transcriptional regulator
MLEINNYISTEYAAFDSSTTIKEVEEFSKKVPFLHFPILEGSVFIGCISKNDLETFEQNKTITNYRYSLEVFFARSTMIWLDVLEVFAKNQTNIVPVLNETNQYIGYYEITEIIKLFNETTFLKEPGGIIIVEKGVLEFSMSEAVQIVESNNGKVLGILVSDATADAIQATIKIALGGMNEILQTFRRYNYTIISEHQEDTYLNSLKERSDYLDKYLNL